MVQLTEEMVYSINSAREDGYPCIVATASGDGVPNAGYIGTVLAVDGESFVCRDRSGRDPVRTLRRTPRWWSCTAMRSET